MRLSPDNRGSRSRRRVAISEIMGSLIMIAITLIAGAAVFGFVNGQANSSASQLGASQASNINYLREKETITLVTFDSNTGISDAVSAYVYNYGGETLTVNYFSMKGPACPAAIVNCGDSNVTLRLIYNSQSSPQWSCTPKSTLYCTVLGVPTCASESPASGSLATIPIQQTGKVSVSLSTCTFAFAAASSPPLKYSFTINVQGQFGSSSSAIVTQ